MPSLRDGPPIALVTAADVTGRGSEFQACTARLSSMTQQERAGVDQRKLGRTGLTVSRLGLGLAALGRPAYINLGHSEDLPDERGVAELQAHAHHVLDAAYEAGIRYVDAARSYGRAEEFVASWLDTRRHPDVVVGSKWGYTYIGGWRMDAEQHEIKDHSLAALRRQAGESRAVLGRRLRLYQIHSATLDSGVLEDPAVLAELGDLAAEGLAIGLSLSGPQQGDALRRALELTTDGTAPLACVQATWNLLEPSVGPALAEAKAAGWGVIVKEALANGRLTGRGEPGGALAELARTHGVGVDAIALAGALAQPFADVVLSGAANTGQLRSNLGALDVQLDLEELARLEELAGPASSYWSTRSELSWT